MSTKSLIISLFLVSLLTQLGINYYFYHSIYEYFQSQENRTKSTINNIANTGDRLLNILTDINFKLDVKKNDSKLDIDITHENQEHSHKEKEEHNLIQDTRDIKNNLLNDIYNYDMTLSSFLSDPRLNLLSKTDRNEIYAELVRRIDAGEINKNSFLPGFKQN